MAPACSIGKRQRKAANTSATQFNAATVTIAKGYGHANPKAASMTIMPTSAIAVPETCQPDNWRSRATPRRTVSPQAKTGIPASATGTARRLSAAATAAERTIIMPSAMSIAKDPVPNSVYSIAASLASIRAAAMFSQGKCRWPLQTARPAARRRRCTTSRASRH